MKKSDVIIGEDGSVSLPGIPESELIAMYLKACEGKPFVIQGDPQGVNQMSWEHEFDAAVAARVEEVKTPKKAKGVPGPVVPSEGRVKVWSCGGGVQSCAIAALICLGKLPKPDIAMIVDTGREKQTTWEYLHAVLVPNLRAVGVEIVIVKTSDFATVDLWGGEEGKSILLPMFTTAADGAKAGKLPTYCSNEWKARVVQRYLRSVGVKACDVWMGMSTDEMKRVTVSGLLWYQKTYPLIYDIPMSRADCVDLVMSVMGWPEPPRSACYMCPNMGEEEWLDLYQNNHADFLRACALELEIQQTDPHAFLHPSGVLLSLVDWSEDARNARKGLYVAVSGCQSGMCFV